MNREIPEYLEEEWQTAKEEYKVKTTSYITITKFEYEKLQQENQSLKEINSFSKRELYKINKDRLDANLKLVEENKRLKEIIGGKKSSIKSLKIALKERTDERDAHYDKEHLYKYVLDEIREYINKKENMKLFTGAFSYGEFIGTLEEILDKVKE